MPLEIFNGPVYLHRHRVLVSAEDAENVTQDGTNYYRLVMDVPDFPEKVEALELVDYCMPMSMVGSFMDADPTNLTFSGFNYLDIRMQDYPAVANTLEFSYKFPSRQFKNADEFSTFLAADLNSVMDEQGDLFFNTAAGVSFRVDQDQEFLYSGARGAVTISAEIGGVPDTVALYFLFTSGSNSADSAWQQLGYETQADVGGPDTINGTFLTYPMPTKYINLHTFRYVNMEIPEFPELRPHSRVYLTPTEDFRRVRQNNKGVRLIVNPPRKVERITVILTLPDGRKPNPDSRDPFYLTIDFLSLSVETQTPGWLKQYLKY